MGANLGLNFKKCDETVNDCSVASKQLVSNHEEILRIFTKIANDTGSNAMQNAVNALKTVIGEKIDSASKGVKDISTKIEEIVEDFKRIDD